MDHIADRILDHGDLRAALRDLLRQGAQLPSGRHLSGLRDLLERLRERRQQHLQRYNMNSIIEEIKRQLEQVVQMERSGIERRLTEIDRFGRGAEAGDASTDETNRQLRDMLERMARAHLDQLDALPPDVGGRIRSLRDYEFMEPEARQKFEELLQQLQQQVLNSYFEGMKQALGAMTPEMMRQVHEMVRDLNELLEQHRMGDDSGFEQFMKKWGQFFPDGIRSVEQLAEHLHQQMAHMQALMDSMTPEMRRELEQMLADLFQDPGLQRALAELIANLDRMFPGARAESFEFGGEEPITLQEAMQLMRDMEGLGELERELLDAVQRNDATGLDTSEIGRLLGDEARRMAEELKDLIRMLEEAGFIRRRGTEWTLTPRAIRKIGERALEDIFGRIDRGLAGDHSLSRFGWGVEHLDETKRYEFGDAFTIDSFRTVMNALRREGRGTPVRLRGEDFEVYQTSAVNQCSTVIMLDMSYSMLYGGRFEAGRKVALALDSLIRTKFPRDELKVVAFSYFVLPLEPHMLLDTYWIDPRGTDFPEALRTARNMLARRRGGTKQIIMITDGEPHANSVGWGSYGTVWSMRQAMEDTLREVKACAREGITVNTFMLDTEPMMTEFIKTMTRVNRGRVFFADPRRLGEYLIVDYVKNRRRVA